MIWCALSDQWGCWTDGRAKGSGARISRARSCLHINASQSKWWRRTCGDRTWTPLHTGLRAHGWVRPLPLSEAARGDVHADRPCVGAEGGGVTAVGLRERRLREEGVACPRALASRSKLEPTVRAALCVGRRESYLVPPPFLSISRMASLESTAYPRSVMGVRAKRVASTCSPE